MYFGKYPVICSYKRYNMKKIDIKWKEHECHGMGVEREMFLYETKIEILFYIWNASGGTETFILLNSTRPQDRRLYLLRENLGSDQKFVSYSIQSWESHCLWNCLSWTRGISELDNRAVQWTVMCIKK